MVNYLDDEANEAEEAKTPTVASADEASAQETDAAASTGPANESRPAWPFPTAAGMADAETTQHTA
ncbi:MULTISPECIES: hypothetical protein [Burkholderia]|uniref:hypothetical protein n=1 Tax=Burkholderia TaxID=32008 RepID=UPI0011601F86|nr:MULTISPECIES: hypothetical protein [Burkholderia]